MTLLTITFIIIKFTIQLTLLSGFYTMLLIFCLGSILGVSKSVILSDDKAQDYKQIVYDRTAKLSISLGILLAILTLLL